MTVTDLSPDAAVSLDPGAEDRARGALLGLAVGDAMGFPAMYHRTIPLGWRRKVLWQFATELDEQQVLRFPLPFTLGPPEALALCATDDAETAAVVALALLEAPPGTTDGDVFLKGWRRYVVDANDAWLGIAERSSVNNIRAGVLPPASGNDNPAHFDDGAVARAVPVGIRYAGRPGRAATAAAAMAAMTHAEDGIWAAAAMAAAVATGIGGGDTAAVVDAAREQIPPHSWLGRTLVRALALAADAATPLDLAADLADEVANASYSYGTVAPETLPAALALITSANGSPEALVAALAVAKQADSLPAMTGALCGALGGTTVLPARWVEKVRILRGVTLPTLTGTDLQELADRLLTNTTDLLAQPSPA